MVKLEGISCDDEHNVGEHRLQWTQTDGCKGPPSGTRLFQHPTRVVIISLITFGRSYLVGRKKKKEKAFLKATVPAPPDRA